MHRLLVAAIAAGALLCSSPSAAIAVTCGVFGDSIGLGVGTELKRMHKRNRANPLCAVNAKVGISSKAVIARVRAADVVVVSAGSNDPTNKSLRNNLESIRSRAAWVKFWAGRPAVRVVWILPVNARARAIVASVAKAHGDKTVRFTPGRDHVHPRSYGVLGRNVLAVMK